MRGSVASAAARSARAQRRREAAGVVTPAPRDIWNEVYESDALAMVYQTPAWVDLMCSFAGYEDASRLYQLPEGRFAVLPLVRRRVLGATIHEESFPSAWSGGGLIASGGVQPPDIAKMFADLTSRHVARITLRPNPLLAPAWETVRPACVHAVARTAHTLDLAGGFDEVWSKRFTSNARQNARRAERSGVRVECDTSGRLIPRYFELFEQSLNRWAAEQHEPRLLSRLRGHRRESQTKLQAIAQTLGDRWLLWLAWVDEQPAAAIVVVEGPSASYTRGAMNKELTAPTRANYLLHRLAIEHACQSGCRYYHMGESGTSRRLAQFKTRFGAEAHQFAEYHIEALPFTAADRALRTAVKRAIRFKDLSSD